MCSGHVAYQKHVISQIRQYYPNSILDFDSNTWDMIERFYSLDLSSVDQILQDCYSIYGPKPRFPSDMLRSYLLSIKFKVTSLTSWVKTLRQNHLCAILSGFTINDTPGIGTFYDFLKRLWMSDNNNISSSTHPPKAKPKRPSKEGEKAAPVEKITVNELLDQFQINPPTDFEPTERLFSIFKSLFLDKSAYEGLIDLDNLAVSGDETPVYTGARERKTRTCRCLENGIRDCKCDRVYHQPDCNMGWDSHRNRHYFGYDLYMLTASDSRNDLPVFPFLGPASRHDSHGFLFNWFSMKQYLPEAHVTKVILDSAHNAMAFNKYFRKHKIKAFIDLNGKGGHPPIYKEDFTINNLGIPLCREGVPHAKGWYRNCQGTY